MQGVNFSDVTSMWGRGIQLIHEKAIVIKSNILLEFDNVCIEWRADHWSYFVANHNIQRQLHHWKGYAF